MATKLPPKPDFGSLESAALKTADRRTMVLALIGNLIFSWSNNESMFIYVLMLLMDTDEVSAAIVFSTLNTTRARLDLVQRLAKVRIADKSVQKKLESLIDRFNDTTRVRNEFNHAMYEMNEKGEITHTHAMRIVERKGKLKFGDTKKIDENRIDEISSVIRELRDWNREIWDFLPQLKQHLDKTRIETKTKP